MAQQPNIGLGKRAASFIAILAGYAILFLSILIGIEVVGRKMFGFSLQGVDEIGGYVAAVVGVFSFTWALLEEGHTRIDVLLDRIGEPARSLLYTLSNAAMALTAIFLTWRTMVVAIESYNFGSFSATPLRTRLWVPQGLFAVGFAIFAITSCGKTIQLICAYVSGQRNLDPAITELELEGLVEQNDQSGEPKEEQTK